MDADVQKLDLLFWVLFMAAQVVGILSVLLVFYWCVSFAGGFGFSRGHLFQWHPLLASIGIIYLLGNAILMFRIFHQPKRTLKRMHAAVSALGLVSTVAAALAVLLRPHSPGKSYLYSMHSWLGALAVTLYGLQAIVSVTAFLLDAFPTQVKASLMPFHRYVGHAVFILGIGAAVSGVNEIAIFKLGANYSKLGKEAILFNSMGILFAIFGLVVVYLSTNNHYKRFPRPQDSQQPMRNILSTS